jgi:hypothetical protein
MDSDPLNRVDEPKPLRATRDSRDVLGIIDSPSSAIYFSSNKDISLRINASRRRRSKSCVCADTILIPVPTTGKGFRQIFRT